MDEETEFDLGPLAVEIDDGEIKPAGILFAGWAVLPSVWLGGDRPKSNKEKIFLADAVMAAGKREFGDWSEEDLKVGSKRLDKIAHWLLECIRKGSIKAFGRAELGDTFQGLDDALWLRWDAFPRFFWCCQIPAPSGCNEPLLIYLDQKSFNYSLGVMRSNTPLAVRQRNIQTAVEFFEDVFRSDPSRLQRKPALMEAARSRFPNLGQTDLDRSWDGATEKWPERKLGGRPRKRWDAPEIG